MKRICLLLNIGLVFCSVVFAQTQEKWQEFRSTHFIVYFKNASEDFIRQVSNRSEDYYNQIADDLGFRRFDFWLWDKRAKIYIYDNARDYQSGTRQPEWSGGCAQVKFKVIQSFPYAKGFLETILPHEMGHIIFREFVGFTNPAVPLWLDEGVASFQEKAAYSDADKFLKEALRKGTFMSLDKLSVFNPFSGADKESVRLFYAEAFSIINFLIREFRKDNFITFCQNLRDKLDLRAAIASVYPFTDIQALDEAWQKNLQK